MKNYFLCLFIILFINVSYSQKDINPCGTIEGRSEWLINYQKNPNTYPRTNTKLYVPLKIHLVGTDKGKGRISPEKLLGTLCTINRDFEEAEIEFYFAGDLNNIDNSNYLFHSTILEGADMMFANNVENAVNIYIVSDPAGNCGYNLPYAGIALGINCANPTDHTLSHELGHNFSLPHPFLGWEGGVSYDNSVPHNYNNPAPEKVTIDYTYFKDTLIRDTLIIDTVWVEKVDGSNCTFAADGFCDTKPDYISVRWQCNGMGQSSTQQTDPDGIKFRSDGSLIMSYSDDNCAVRFSSEQVQAMRANITDQRSNLLYDQSEPILISDPRITLISPKNGQVEDYRYINLEWEEVPQATHYAVKISTNANFTSKLYEGIVTTNSVIADIDKAWQNRKLYWGVIPFNHYDFCNSWSTIDSFITSEISSTITENNNDVKFHPTILKSFQILKTNYIGTIPIVELIDLTGNVIKKYSQVNQEIQLPNEITSGVYFLRIYKKDNINITQKIFLE